MAILRRTNVQMDKIDQQMLDLLEQRALLYGEAVDEGGAAEDDEEIVDMWVEWGMERGLDETAVERVCRSVITLSRKSAE